MRNNEVHVVHRQGSWVVEVTGENAEQQFETQREAIEAGRQLAKEREKELVIHGEDNAIREKDSFGGDPRDIPG